MAGLNDNDREFLAYALDVAEGRMAIRPGEFSDWDRISLLKLRHVATCTRLCAELCGRGEGDD